MAATGSDAVTACPYCGATGSGRFCADCGKERAIDASSVSVVKEVFGVKLPPVRDIARTAAMACRQPELLSRRWSAGERRGLISPVAMMSTVTALSAAIGALLAFWFGARQPTPEETINLSGLLDAAPFLRTQYPQQVAGLMGAPETFAQAFQRVGSWLIAFWPALFLVPGYLAMAPWRRMSPHLALIVACVETIFILLVTALYSSLRLIDAGLAQNALVTTAMWIAVWAHTAIHVRRATGSGWGYAVARPALASLYFLVVTYVWVVFVMILTLWFWPQLSR